MEKVLKLCKIPKIYMTVSLDGPQHLHERIRNKPGSWERAVETFKRLRKLRSKHFNVFFGMTLQAANLCSFRETLDAVRERIGDISCDDFHVNMVHSSKHYYGDSDVAENFDKMALWESLNQISKSRKNSFFDPVRFLEKQYLKHAKIFLKDNSSPVLCQALSASFFMDPIGNVYPCSIYGKKVGNITDFNYDIYKLWNTEIRSSLRKEIRKAKCPICWTPCEAYQSLLANFFSIFRRYGND
jgi:radical SAM protein with 4Fe4S-binding SPASM domain